MMRSRIEASQPTSLRWGVCLAVLTLAGSASAHADQTVTIGIGTALSGIQAAVGKDLTNGAQLAVDELNARHLRIGDQPVQWKLMVEDDQVDPRQAVVVAQKFVDAKVNGVVGHLSSAATFPASAIYEHAGIPLVVPSATVPKLAQRGFKTFFRVITNDDALNDALARYAVQRLHAKTLVIIDDRTAYGQGLADGFAVAAKRHGLRLLGRDYTSDKATDFSAILTRARALHPDLIFYGGIYAQAGTMLKQMKALGVGSHYMGGDMLCVPELARQAGDAVKPVVCGEGGVPLERMPTGLAWKQRYDARFGAAQYQIFSPYTYDATMVLAAAMVAADSVDPKVYLKAMHSVDWNGVTRDHIRFLPDGDLRDPVVTLSSFASGSKQRIAD